MSPTNDKVVHLAFRNDKLEPEELSLYACTACRNKAYRLIDKGESSFPVLQCCACNQNIGPIGWADEQQ